MCQFVYCILNFGVYSLEYISQNGMATHKVHYIWVDPRVLPQTKAQDWSTLGMSRMPSLQV
jgi:hypothetical protein